MKSLRPLPLLVSAGLVLGCAGIKQTASTTGAGGGFGASTGAGGSGNNKGTGGGSGTSAPTACRGACDDFGGGPFGPDGTSGSVPSGAAQLFGGGSSGSGGPCLFEPQDGTLFPSNWLRPRFSWTATGDLYELHVSVANQADDLIVYTDQTSWTMPATMWQALAIDSADTTISATISSSSHGGAPSKGTSNAFSIAPVTASGNLVYWSPSGSTSGGMIVSGNTTLNGFSVGDETVKQVLTCGPDSANCDIKSTYWETFNQGLTPRPVSCIGCHTSTPDGNFISFNDFYPWGGVLASGQSSNMGMPPGFFGGGGYNAFRQPWVGITTYSGNHWADGDHVVVAPLGTTTNNNDANQQSGLAWFDLESAASLLSGQNPYTALQGTAWDWIYKPVGTNYAAAPSWSRAPNDDFIVFTMTNNVKSGRLGTGTGHLYSVPYAKTGPQTAKPIPGDGSDPNYAQYYGTLSADDALVVFDRIPAAAAAVDHPDLNTTDQPSGCNNTTCTWSGMYMQPKSELYVMPVSGGTATRLAANDPPSCPGQLASPGINNTWAKWSPEVATSNGKTYYWVIFSSWRQGAKETSGDPVAQLFMTVIVQPEAGPIQTYPAVYLWNQRPDVSNFTPAWDVFKIGSVG